jgi:hypothetical protein
MLEVPENHPKINFLVPVDFLKERLNSLKKFSTELEKESLFVDDDEDIREILKIFTDVVPINDLEAEALLLKLREISVGDEIEYIVTCHHCKMMNNIVVLTSDFYDLKPVEYKGNVIPVGLFSSIDTIINNEEMEKLNVAQYSELDDFIKERNSKVFTKESIKRCRKCGGSISIIIDPRSVYTKSTLADIYKDYVNITMFTNSGKLDVDSLYPFEREIFNNLIADKLKTDET